MLGAWIKSLVDFANSGIPLHVRVPTTRESVRIGKVYELPRLKFIFAQRRAELSKLYRDACDVSLALRDGGSFRLR